MAVEVATSQIAYGYGMQGRAVHRIELMLRPVNIARRNDAPKLAVGCALVPFTNRGETLKRVFGTGIKVEWRVKDKLGSDQAAGVVARRIVIVGAEVIGRTIGQLASGLDMK